jgi:hypothetical protein
MLYGGNGVGCRDRSALIRSSKSLSYPALPEGLQPGSGVVLGTRVALGAGGGVQLDVGDGPLVAVSVAVGGGEVAVGVRVAVGMVDAVDVAEGVCEGVGVNDGVAEAVLVSVGVAVSVGVEVSVGVSMTEGVAVAVLGNGEESCSSGAAVTVSRGSNVGSGVSEGGGTGLGGVGSIAAAI